MIDVLGYKELVNEMIFGIVLVDIVILIILIWKGEYDVGFLG